MKKLSLKAKEIRALGYPEGPVISVAMQVMEKHFRYHTTQQALEMLKNILSSPQQYITDAIVGTIASKLIPGEPATEAGETVSLNQTGVTFNVFGHDLIEQGAMHQLYRATKLPVAVAGALMPDAHTGYGLPIGGVLATHNAVIPYGVGVDIGCRMHLSVFDIDPKELTNREQYFARELNAATLFGGGKEFENSTAHAVLERPEFREIALLKSLQGRAVRQLGSSGSGNHFVEFGRVDITEKDEVWKVPPGHYVGLLSHSGSRALGAHIANYYTRIAKQKRRLPGEANNLAWLLLSEEAGMEYWLAMNLAGDYAAACHEVIHAKIATVLGRKPIAIVENHHNFAWKEQYFQQEVIVHRKGATPAGKDVLGIIPGSMTTPGFIVKGKGQAASLFSAAHGAGRKMSRSAALHSITHRTLKDLLDKQGVTLLGGGLDEAPHAYKDIYQVMQAQKHLVDTIGLFHPAIVRMDGTIGKSWRKEVNAF